MCSLLAAAVLLAACGDDGQDDDRLADFFGGGMDDEAMMAEAEQQQRELEEAIAECMAEEGFEYVPQDLGSMMPDDDPRQELSEEEFREEYGYGISTIDRASMMVGPEDDPNLAIQEELDDAEREAYRRALDGEMPEIDPDGDPEDMVFEPGGCRGEALEEVQGDRLAASQELGPEFQELESRIMSDPRMTEAEQQWQACMQEAGYDYTERFEPQQELNQRFNELQQAGFDEIDPAAIEEGEEPPEPEIDEEALEELQAEELRIAAAEGECTEAHLADVEDEVRADHEADFIEEHRDLLEQLRPEQDG